MGVVSLCVLCFTICLMGLCLDSGPQARRRALICWSFCRGYVAWGVSDCAKYRAVLSASNLLRLAIAAASPKKLQHRFCFMLSRPFRRVRCSYYQSKFSMSVLPKSLERSWIHTQCLKHDNLSRYLIVVVQTWFVVLAWQGRTRTWRRGVRHQTIVLSCARQKMLVRLSGGSSWQDEVRCW